MAGMGVCFNLEVVLTFGPSFIGLNKMDPAAMPVVVPALHLCDAEVGFYKREGYLLIPGLFDEETAAELRREARITAVPTMP